MLGAASGRWSSDLQAELDRLRPLIESKRTLRVCCTWEAVFYSELCEAWFCNKAYNLTIWEGLANIETRQSYSKQEQCFEIAKDALSGFSEMCFLFLSSMHEPPWLTLVGCKHDLFDVFTSTEAAEAFFVEIDFSKALFDTHDAELIVASGSRSQAPSK